MNHCNRFPPNIEELEDRDRFYVYDASSGTKRMCLASTVAKYVQLQNDVHVQSGVYLNGYLTLTLNNGVELDPIAMKDVNFGATAWPEYDPLQPDKNKSEAFQIYVYQPVNLQGEKSGPAVEVYTTQSGVVMGVEPDFSFTTETVLRVNSVSAVDGNAHPNQKVIVSSYNGDGLSGELLFKTVPAGTGVADGGKYIDLPSSGFQLEQLMKVRPDASSWGVVAGSSIDQSSKFQACSDYAKGDFTIPAGIFKCNFILNDSFNINGHSGLTILEPFNLALPAISDRSPPTWFYSRIENVTFGNPGTASPAGVGFMFGPIDWDGTGGSFANRGRVRFVSCVFNKLERGIYKKYGNIGNVYDCCRFFANMYGIYGQGDKVNDPSYPLMHSGNDTFNQCEFDENIIAGAAYRDTTGGAGAWVFNQCIFQYNPGFGVYFDIEVSNRKLYSPIMFNGCWWEGNATSSTVDIENLDGISRIAPSDYQVDGDTLRPVIEIGSQGDFETRIGIGVSKKPVTTAQIDGDMLLSGLGNSFYMGTPGAATASLENEATNGDFIITPKNPNRSVIIPEGATLVAGEPNGSAAGVHRIAAPKADGVGILSVSSRTTGTASITVNAGTSQSWSAQSSCLSVGNGASGRSINASGTINASGADYAEYMLKRDDCGEIKKGDVCGIDANGMLTDKFDLSIKFCIKSTNPSIVGGDVWFNETPPEEKTPEWFIWNDEYLSILNDEKPNDDWEERIEAIKLKEPLTQSSEYIDFIERKEEARKRVDRIAFCGQIPVNYNISAGDYLIPIKEDDGSIGVFITKTPTFEQFIIKVGHAISNKLVIVSM